MRAMKSSDVGYLLSVPENWQVDKLKYHLRRKTIKNHPREQVLSLYREYGVIPKDSRDDNHNVTSEDTSKYLYVEYGDFVVNKMKAWQGSVAISDYRGIVSPAYYVYSFIDEKLNNRYFHYLMRNKAYTPEYRRLSGGIREGQWDLPEDALNEIKILIPPFPEQKRIADFLDAKCAEIDALTADIEKQIEVLEQYRQSIMTEAVTKGSNFNVETKDSGLDWIIKIPVSWEVSKVKYLFDFGKGLGITKDDLTDEGLPVISYGQIHAKTNDGVSLDPDLLRYVDFRYEKQYPQCQVERFGFVFADTSEDLDGCGNCVYKRDEGLTFGGYHSIILRPKEKRDNRYLAYLFQTADWRKQIRTSVSGVKVFSITQKTIMNAYVILPPYEEQEMIANDLDEKCGEIKNVIHEKRIQIDKLKEFRKSLIYEYVTGKKEV